MARLNFTRQQFLDFVRHYRRGEDTDVRDVQELLEQLERLNYRRIDEALNAVSDFVGGFGVEAIRQEGAHVDNYHFDIIGTYVNMGDTYAETLVYDTANETLQISSYGDFVEAWERENAPEEACPSCGQMFRVDELDADSGECPECRQRREEEEESEILTWEPQADQPLIAVLRSIQGPVIAVHFWGASWSDKYQNNVLVLTFSVMQTTDHFITTRYPYTAIERGRNDLPFRFVWDDVFETFERKGATELYVASTNSQEPNVAIEREMYFRLKVAMDAFLETDMKRQPVKEFLATPPVLWTCDQVNEIAWIGGPRAYEGVQALVRKPERVGRRFEFDDITVWEAGEDMLRELVEDGFIKVGDDYSVRSYLKYIGVCRER